MKKLCSIAAAGLMLCSLAACGSSVGATDKNAVTSPTVNAENEAADTAETGNTEDIKVLVAYFSATGNTKEIAETIAETVDADIFEITPVVPYTEADLNYNDDDCRANIEQNDAAARPEISNTIENFDDYDVVIIGHPIWWGEEPRIMDTFMESYDFSGKILADFCTSGGSGIEAATDNLKALTSEGATWLEGRRFQNNADAEDVLEWINDVM